MQLAHAGVSKRLLCTVPWLIMSNSAVYGSRNWSPPFVGSPPLQLQESPLLLQYIHQGITMGAPQRYRSSGHKGIYGNAPFAIAQPPFERTDSQRGQDPRGAPAGETRR